MRRNLICGILLLFFAMPSIEAKNLSILKTMSPRNNELIDVEIEGNLMIIPGGLGGAVIFDISNPEIPVQLSTLRMVGCAWERSYNWDISGNIAIGTARECGMGIFDISAPASPRLLSIYKPDDNRGNLLKINAQISLEDVEIKDNWAIFAAHSDGIMIYDISRPESPKFTSKVATENAMSLTIRNNLVYVADGEGGLSIVDISDISAPIVRSNSTASGSARDIRSHDELLFLAVGASGIDVFDVKDPDNPIFLDNLQTSGFASRLAIHENGNLISVSAWSDVEVMNWDGSKLELVGYKNTGGRVMAVGSPTNDIIYSAEWSVLKIFKFGAIDGPDIDISPRTLSFPRLEPTESNTLSATIENNGNSPLNLTLITNTHPDFSYRLPSNILNPGEHESLDVTYTATDDNAGGRLNIYSDDLDEGLTFITLSGNRSTIVDVGLPAPEFELPAVANGKNAIKLSDLKGKIVVLAFYGSW